MIVDGVIHNHFHISILNSIEMELKKKSSYISCQREKEVWKDLISLFILFNESQGKSYTTVNLFTQIVLDTHFDFEWKFI